MDKTMLSSNVLQAVESFSDGTITVQQCMEQMELESGGEVDAKTFWMERLTVPTPELVRFPVNLSGDECPNMTVDEQGPENQPQWCGLLRDVNTSRYRRMASLKDAVPAVLWDKVAVYAFRDRSPMFMYRYEGELLTKGLLFKAILPYVIQS